MKHGTMEDLLLVKMNNLVWTPKERDEVIEAALEKFMKPTRKCKLDKSETTLGVPAKRRKVQQSDSDSEQSDSSSVCMVDDASVRVSDDNESDDDVDLEYDDDDTDSSFSDGDVDGDLLLQALVSDGSSDEPVVADCD